MLLLILSISHLWIKTDEYLTSCCENPARLDPGKPLAWQLTWSRCSGNTYFRSLLACPSPYPALLPLGRPTSFSTCLGPSRSPLHVFREPPSAAPPVEEAAPFQSLKCTMLTVFLFCFKIFYAYVLFLQLDSKLFGRKVPTSGFLRTHVTAPGSVSCIELLSSNTANTCEYPQATRHCEWLSCSLLPDLIFKKINFVEV